VLETEEICRKRGKEPALYLAGYGSAADAYHLIAPRPDGSGLEAALERAMCEAESDSNDVCFVNAHGTATLDNDRIEGSVLKRIFGTDVKFLSTKGFTGHTLGAAGGLEAAFTAAALREGWIPASAGFVHQDDEILLSPVTKRTSISGSLAVSTSLAFGGNNAAIAIRRCEEGM
jgi:3-oxoacyl-(acyl-carrier-protein) synthase